jgi:hypothetical protein
MNNKSISFDEPSGPPRIPEQMNSNLNKRYVTPMSKKVDAIKEKLDGSWMNPLNIIMVALVGALVLGLVMYYTVALMFDEEATGQGAGVLAGAGWSASGGGIVIILLTVLTIGSAAACLGMGWQNNSQAVIFTALATGLLGLIFYFVFAAVRDEKNDQMVLWAVLGVAASVGVSVYSWWTLRNWAKETEADGVAEITENVKQRARWSMITLAATAIFAAITAAGLWQIHGHVSA